MINDKLHKFNTSISDIELPSRFTFPFYYEPHPLAKSAAEQLQEYLMSQTDFNHNFGLDEDSELGLGKMFGVLVVKDENNEVGFLASFSGKLGDQLNHKYFVPGIFDMFADGSYFVKESKKLDTINKRILALESNPLIKQRKEELDHIISLTNAKLSKQKEELKRYQKERQTKRGEAEMELSEDGFLKLKEEHNQQSINDNFLLREYTVYLNSKVEIVENKYNELISEIDRLKLEMKSMSVALQDWLFEQYQFLNSAKEVKGVKEIFKKRIPDVPPSGAGDCAAPRMLQYAFQNNMKPIAMAEFWWGKSPNSNSRKHKYFYPSCRGKCEPILGHMLSKTEMDPNPLLINPAIGKSLETIYEDEYLIVINKPAEFMSVPGKFVTDSVQERLKAKYPDSTGPMIVHRLDMSTSGIMVVTKNKEVHKILQEQFKTRSVKKRYVALLDGLVENDSGYINLPLRVDLENRPYQIVCEIHGKSARTKYEVLSRSNGQTKIHFYPITGRTHQLRVHASHHLGLNCPIVGDDLYGLKGDRLCLHAESIWFDHPITKKEVHIQVPEAFGEG